MAKTVLYAGDGIKTFIPQREPMLMVDKLLSASETDVETGLTVADSNIFVEGGVLSETGLIEHIAQSAATFAGYNDWFNKRPIVLGYIAEIKKFALQSALPKTGDNIETYMTVVSQAMNITLMNAESKVNGVTVAVCKMKIFMDK